MIVKSSSFVTSAVTKDHYPETDLPEIAFAGRSNVGKSSLINLLTNRKKLAKISGKPGKTRLLNFFLINENCHFVDLPGYGYASVAKNMQRDWGSMIENYLESRENLRCVVLLVDIRHEPSKEDKQMMEYLKYFNIPTIIACTKGDKIAKGKRAHYMKKIKEALDAKSFPIVTCSTLEKGGVEGLLGEIGLFLGEGESNE